MDISILKDRANMLSLARSFFKERGVLEVDCPLLSKGASVDLHIDLIPAYFDGKEKRFLHSSPEYGMKRLLVQGFPDCYQLSHVFRDKEVGRYHNPEFMMAEWYRLSSPFDKMIEETLDFIELFLSKQPRSYITYRKAFETYVGINPFSASLEDLVKVAKKFNISLFEGALDEGKEAILSVLLSTLIEPKLGESELTVLYAYPATQAALAKTKVIDGDFCAERFEVYFEGVELCNGYHELGESKELRERFDHANQERVLIGKEPLPLDESFLKAMERGLPPCSGVAVGFDRLMMLRHKANSLKDVISFDWESS